MATALTAVDPVSDTETWTAPFPQDPDALNLGSPTPNLAAGDNLVVVHHVTRVSAFDATTGRQRWTARFDPRSDRDTVPAVGEHLVMIPRSSTACQPGGTSR